jgi:hypothetical protein
MTFGIHTVEWWFDLAGSDDQLPDTASDTRDIE